MKRMVIVMIIVIGLAGAAIVQGVSSLSGEREELPKVGFQAPAFSLPGLGGKTYTLDRSIGKPVVINFWASWCGPCKLEAPDLVEMYEKYRNDLEIYAVNLTYNDTMSDVKAFVVKYGYEFPVLIDQGPKNTISKLYGIQPVPTTFFVDRHGKIIDIVIGPQAPNVLGEKIKRLIAIQ